MTLSVALRHRLGGFTLDATFDAPAGVTALFGRSGAGKTSVVRAVAGLIRPDFGQISLDGRVLTDTDAGVFVPPHRRRVGYVFQDARLFPHLSVRANLLYGARGRDADLSHITDLLGIGALLDRRPASLSGGERQRAAIGRALLSAPDILLMDEPLASLDTARKAEILPYLERLRDETEVPILYVSHATAEVARLATTLVLIEDGKVRQAGPVGAMLCDPEVGPLFGLGGAGAVLVAMVGDTDDDGLTRLETGAGPLWLPRVGAAVGAKVRVRIRADDVILSRARPEGLSALNILRGTVTMVREGDGPGVLVQIALGDERLLSRVTRRSARALGLAPGVTCHAVLKSVAVAREDVGTGG